MNKLAWAILNIKKFQTNAMFIILVVIVFAVDFFFLSVLSVAFSIGYDSCLKIITLLVGLSGKQNVC